MWLLKSLQGLTCCWRWLISLWHTQHLSDLWANRWGLLILRCWLAASHVAHNHIWSFIYQVLVMKQIPETNDEVEKQGWLIVNLQWLIDISMIDSSPEIFYDLEYLRRVAAHLVLVHFLTSRSSVDCLCVCMCISIIVCINFNLKRVLWRDSSFVRTFLNTIQYKESWQ